MQVNVPSWALVPAEPPTTLKKGPRIPSSKEPDHDPFPGSLGSEVGLLL